MGNATQCWTGDCPSCWCPSNELDSTDEAHELRSVEMVRAQLKEARADLLNPDGKPQARKMNKVKEKQRELKCKLMPHNAWMDVKDFELFTRCPKDELHQWFLGLYGEHIIPAVVHKISSLLQREDLVDDAGRPLISVGGVKAVWARLAGRLSSIEADTSMVTVSQAFAAHFLKVYVEGKKGAKYTGDRMKILMLTLPFVFRDLITPEV